MIVLGFLRFLLGIILGVFLLYQVLPLDKEGAHFEEFALGQENAVVFGQVDGVEIHCQDLNDLDRCLVGYETRGLDHPVVLWLGNSQLHAINQYSTGEETAVPELHQRLHEQGQYLMTLSQPNSSLQEHLLLFTYLFKQIPISTLVLPVVFDDMREDGIRTSLVATLKDHSASKILQTTSIGQALIANYGDQDAAGNDMAALEETVQQRSEEWLNIMLEEQWPLWAERAYYRGKFMISLHLLRNRVFGIDPTSIRKIIPGRYAKNREAFEMILDLADKVGIDVLVYVVPLRNDVKIPYDLDEYVAFKAEIMALSDRRRVHFVNLEDLVPPELWGTKGSTVLGEEKQEIDFMHFQAGGHRLLAESLYQELSNLWGFRGK